MKKVNEYLFYINRNLFLIAIALLLIFSEMGSNETITRLFQIFLTIVALIYLVMDRKEFERYENEK